MVRRVVLGATLLLALTVSASPYPAALPVVSFQDQEGRELALAALRGQVVVIVYGTRAGLEHHVAWGKRLDGDLRRRGVYREHDAPRSRAVQILALAQMGGVPGPFRPLIRGVMRGHVEAGHSLWLDWGDLMSTLFGASDSASTVVVADREGAVRLVVSGEPDGAPYRAVTELLHRLL